MLPHSILTDIENRGLASELCIQPGWLASWATYRGAAMLRGSASAGRLDAAQALEMASR